MPEKAGSGDPTQGWRVASRAPKTIPTARGGRRPQRDAAAGGFFHRVVRETVVGAPSRGSKSAIPGPTVPGYALQASMPTQEQTRFRSPNTLSTRPTAGQNLNSQSRYRICRPFASVRAIPLVGAHDVRRMRGMLERDCSWGPPCRPDGQDLRMDRDRWRRRNGPASAFDLTSVGSTHQGARNRQLRVGA